MFISKKSSGCERAKNRVFFLQKNNFALFETGRLISVPYSCSIRLFVVCKAYSRNVFYSAVFRLTSSYNIVILLVVHFAILLIMPVLIVRFICHRQRSQTHPLKEGKHPIELKYKCKRTTHHHRKRWSPPLMPSAQEGKAVAILLL